VNPQRLLDGLDERQRETVLCPPTATIVRAGAGSGKTRVLTHRIAHRILDGSAQAQHVLAITFTREAAGEMRRRLATLGVAKHESGTPVVGTFHAVALSLLRQRLADLGQSMPNIVHNRIALAVAAAEHHPIGKRPRDLLFEIDWAHARRIPPQGYAQAVKREQRITTVSPMELADLYKRYETVKKRRHVVDLDDLISRVVTEMHQHADYAEAVRWRFRHLFVDEAQDMNPLQYDLFEAIRGGRSDVFVVGDPLQAIYGWNGSDHRLFDDLPNVLPHPTIFSLPNNYRCSPHIVSAARHVAAFSGQRVDVRAVRDRGDPVRVVNFSDETAEADGIAALLWRHAPTAGARPWSSTAVLVRTNAQIPPIAGSLAKSGIPVHSSRPSPEIRAAVDLAAQCGGRHALTTWAIDVLNDSTDDAERAVADLVNRFLHLDQPGVVDGRTFAAWVSANATETTITEPGVELLTFHSAKGREWDCVVVAGAEVGLLPHRSASSSEQRAEESRLAYVALTRASNTLFITHATTRGGRTTGASPLIAGLPSTLATSADEPPPPRVTRTPDERGKLLDELVEWRRRHARRIVQDPEMVCSDEELATLANVRPETEEGLAAIIGPLTAARLSSDLLPLLRPLWA
jgi:DNA helicase II / ATP-dependent DNA helicase PcrA